MNDDLNIIISKFLKIPKSEINNQTIIDSSAVKGINFMNDFRINCYLM